MNRIFGFVLITCIAAFGQEQEKKPRIEFKVRRVDPGPRVKNPAPGDKIEIDAATGDLIVEHRGRDARLKQQQIQLGTKVRPDVAVNFEMTQPGFVRYSYTLTNGSGAGQGIGLFAVAMNNPDLLLNIEAPPNWRASGPSLAGWGTPSRYNWWSQDPMGLLPPATIAGFSFLAPALPGLTILYTQGAGPTMVPGIEEMSPWLEEEIHRATRLENNSVRPHTIGPKIPLGAQIRAETIINGVRSELMLAINVPGIGDRNPELINLATTLESADRTKALSLQPTFLQIGSSPLEKAFFSAMAFNLGYAASLP